MDYETTKGGKEGGLRTTGRKQPQPRPPQTKPPRDPVAEEQSQQQELQL